MSEQINLNTTEKVLKNYIPKYHNYMKSLSEDLVKIREDMSNPECPRWIRDTLVNTSFLLGRKKNEYEEMHQLILNEPTKYEKEMEMFIMKSETN